MNAFTQFWNLIQSVQEVIIYWLFFIGNIFVGFNIWYPLFEHINHERNQQ
jgi:hypothetical protein